MTPRSRRRFWLVTIETATVHRVYAKDDAEALDLCDVRPDSLTRVEQITTHCEAALDADQTRHDRRVDTLETRR